MVVRNRNYTEEQAHQGLRNPFLHRTANTVIMQVHAEEFMHTSCKLPLEVASSIWQPSDSFTGFKTSRIFKKITFGKHYQLCVQLQVSVLESLLLSLELNNLVCRSYLLALFHTVLCWRQSYLDDLIFRTQQLVEDIQGFALTMQWQSISFGQYKYSDSKSFE